MISRSLRGFLGAYQPARALMVNLALSHVDRIGETEIEWLMPWQLCGGVEEVLRQGPDS